MCPDAKDIPDDSVLVVIADAEQESMTFDEWLTCLAGDGPTDVDANEAEILREIRDHGEG